MDGLITGLVQLAQGLPFLDALRMAPKVYPVVSAIHIGGLGLLFGAIVVADVTLIRTGSIEAAGKGSAISVATLGLAVAVTSGFLLFAVRPEEYAALPLFSTKLGLVILGCVNAAVLHLAGRWTGSGGAKPQRWVRLCGLLSVACWGAVIYCGRMLAFA